jgi:methyl-accepting chemotaxis protein
MNVGTRLAFSFGITLVATLLLVVISLGSMHRFSKDVDDLTHTRVPLLIDLQVVSGVTRAQAVMERDALAALTANQPQQADAQLTAIDAGHEQVGKAVSDIKERLSTEQEKQLWARVLEVRGSYLSSRSGVMNAIRQGRSDDARQMLLTQQVPLENAYMDAVQALTDLIVREADADGRNVDGSYSRAAVIVVALAIFVFAAGIAGAFWVTRSVVGRLRVAVDTAARVSRGDLRVQRVSESRDEIGQLLRSLSDMAKSLGGIVTQIQLVSESVGAGAEQIAQGNTDLSQRTVEQAAALEQTAASLNELTSAVKQNAESTRHAREMADNAHGIAAHGNTIIGEVVATMAGIDESSHKIDEITGIIDGIAFQTNILALNAAVEAARAGEQGRGFAVVASEVRSLAQRSSAAAKQITELIGISTQRVEAGTQLVARAGETMGRITSAIEEVVAIMAGITSASDEQRRGIEQIAQAVSHMDSVTQQNAALVDQATAASKSLHDQSRQLQDAVAAFDL